ncbi:MAG: heme peroxidase family protein [Acidobacteriota bacterium]
MSDKHHGMMAFEDQEHLCRYRREFVPGRFARLLAELPPLYLDPEDLHTLGAKGGPMEDKGAPNLTKTVPAGLIFFGQFLDHDITLDVTSSLTGIHDPTKIENVRTPTLDLDGIYGDGPKASPHLYNGAGKLLTGEDYAEPINPNDLARQDLPRTPTGTAIIGDPRNDENRVVSQLQLGFLRLHNKVVEAISDKYSGAELFEEARRIVTWHYHWVVLFDFLPAICGDWIVDDILSNGRKIYRPAQCNALPFIPIEFSVAAYGFGYTMVPPKMRVQTNGPQHNLFGPVLGGGFRPVLSKDEVVEWAALLDDRSGSDSFERAGKVEPKLASSLLDLPFMPPTTPPFLRSLATRNLLLGQSFLLPSGEQVARHLREGGADEVEEDGIEEVRKRAEAMGLPKATPLWIYCLIEGRWIGRQRNAGAAEKGEGLGPVGARLVAETLIGLMEEDPRSFLSSNRSWSPAEEAHNLGAEGVDNLYRLLTF